MTATPTNAAFLTAIRNMTVTDVNRYFNHPPASVDTADLYAAFPLLMEAGLGEPLTSCIDNHKTRSIGYVIVVEPVGQDTQKANYDKLAAVMDNLETALDALSIANFIEYDISATGNFTIGRQTYWAIQAEIRAYSA